MSFPSTLSIALVVFVTLLPACATSRAPGEPDAGSDPVPDAQTTPDAASNQTSFVICPAEDEGCDYIGGDGLQQAIVDHPGASTAPTQLTMRAGSYTRAVGTSYVGDTDEEHIAFALVDGEFIQLVAEGQVVLDGANSAAMSGIVARSGNIAAQGLTLSAFATGTCAGEVCPGGYGVIAFGNAVVSMREFTVADVERDAFSARQTALLDAADSSLDACDRALFASGEAQLALRRSVVENMISDIGRVDDTATLTLAGVQLRDNARGLTAFNGSISVRNCLFVRNNDPLYGVDAAVFEIVNNTFVDSEIAAVNMYHCSGNDPAVTLVNNIFYGTLVNSADDSFGYGTGGGCWGSTGAANDSKSYNAYFGNARQNVDCGSHEYCPAGSDVQADPQFVNAAAGDYHLQSASLSYRTGDDNLQNPDGSRSDRGAYGGPGACDLDTSLPGC